MTLYLTDNTPPAEIEAAKASGFVHAVKYYPAGATTNSDSGVTALDRVYPCWPRWNGTASCCRCTARSPIPPSTCSTVSGIRGHAADAHRPRFSRAARSCSSTSRPARRSRSCAKRRPTSAPRSRRIICCGRATRFSPAACDRTLLPADPQAGNAPAGAGRRGDVGQSALFSRHGLGAACEAHQGRTRAAARDATRRMRRSSCTRRLSTMRTRSKLEGFASHFGADFYGLPRNDGFGDAGARTVERSGRISVRRRNHRAAARGRNDALAVANVTVRRDAGGRASRCA